MNDSLIASHAELSLPKINPAADCEKVHLLGYRVTTGIDLAVVQGAQSIQIQEVIA